MNFMTLAPLIMISLLLNTIAQVMLKEAMNRIGAFAFSLSNVFPIGIKMATNPFIIAGIACYVISVGSWLLVLSRCEVSVVYPLTSIGYIMTAIGATYFLGENLSMTRIIGIFVIIVGVYLITRS